jgi:ribosomal protein S18 acetylase RimI-like enzyme
MEIIYSFERMPDTEEVIKVYNSSGIRRPTADFDRIAEMYQNSSLVVTAYDDDVLVGVARCLTDFCYACYLSDLAVDKNYQSLGIGRKLVDIVIERIGEKTALILLSAPKAVDYYPKIGFESVDNGFIVKRKR